MPSVYNYDYAAQKYHIEFTDKQLLALWLLNLEYTKELLYGGAKGKLIVPKKQLIKVVK